MADTDDFALHPRLAADTSPVVDLALSRVLLMDDARYPWLILVPMRPGLREIYDLVADDQATLWQEVTRVGEILMRATGGDKLNVAALGNQVPQLHMHVIARRTDDAVWPGPVWGVGQAETRDMRVRDALVKSLREALSS
ncbi:HIT family protein [Salinisphaera sp. P385]|uniref:HIT family protein n=1 Tax=Spectribacter acetivorans TaxID=3075603 RepID=A0ABU3BB11_9GAMM|nr:HIT family protein [Salinisphaera sp. P385]MDT0619220.1 HIT family protein [Salinisphaera sp. P385]